MDVCSTCVGATSHDEYGVARGRDTNVLLGMFDRSLLCPDGGVFDDHDARVGFRVFVPKRLLNTLSDCFLRLYEIVCPNHTLLFVQINTECCNLKRGQILTTRNLFYAIQGMLCLAVKRG